MKRQTVLMLLLLAVIPNLVACSGTPRASQQRGTLPDLPFAQELQDALDRALQEGQRDHDLGISAAVIVPGYEIWSGVSGNSHRGVPVTPDMLFDAGSVAKNFEAALVLKLVEQGKLALDDSISRWLPPYRNVPSGITVRQLLNHTSGLFNVFEHPDFPWIGSDVDYTKHWIPEDVFETFVLEPYGPPGTVQHYSSTNYLLLTAIIDEVAGISAPALIERYLLEPLGLRHTVMSMGEPPPARFAVAHPMVDVDQDGDLDDLWGTPCTWIASLTHPLLRTTPSDLVHWIHALYQERTVLAPTSLAEMLTYPETAVPDPEGGTYGLGVVDYSELLGVHVIGHGGSSLGYSAAALYFPDYGAALAWLVNTGESPRELANALMGGTWSSLSQVLQNHLNPQR
ncbi:MAG: serine hydrolase [Gemmatimonadales bacterium]